MSLGHSIPSIQGHASPLRIRNTLFHDGIRCSIAIPSDLGPHRRRGLESKDCILSQRSHARAQLQVLGHKQRVRNPNERWMPLNESRRRKELKAAIPVTQGLHCPLRNLLNWKLDARHDKSRKRRIPGRPRNNRTLHRRPIRSLHPTLEHAERLWRAKILDCLRMIRTLTRVLATRNGPPLCSGSVPRIPVPIDCELTTLDSRPRDRFGVSLAKKPIAEKQNP